MKLTSPGKITQWPHPFYRVLPPLHFLHCLPDTSKEL